MGQNGSSSGLDRRASKKYAPGDFNPPSTLNTTRRSNMSGAPATRRHSSAGTPSATPVTPHRRAASNASNTAHAAYRANNIASTSPPPYSTTRIPQTIPEVMPPINQIVMAGQENALELLKQYDTVFLIDDSGSMAGSLWREAGRALADVARVAAQYDDDGIDIYFLNSKECLKGVTGEEQVRQLFTRIQPRGQTPTGARLDTLLRAYISSIIEAYQETGSTDPAITGIKPVNFIIITDGAPTDEPEDVIVDAARKLDRGDFPLSQLGIQFVQIGNDPEARAALEELDDDLAGKYGIRDIVDTTPYHGGLTGETLIKILLGGINRRVDKRGGASVMR